MAKHPRLAIERIPNGTNLTRVTFKGVNAADVGEAARRARHCDVGAGQARDDHVRRERNLEPHDGWPT